jgi:hypothetical protein
MELLATHLLDSFEVRFTSPYRHNIEPAIIPSESISR